MFVDGLREQTILREPAAWQFLGLILMFRILVVSSFGNIVPFIFYRYSVFIDSVMIRSIGSLRH